MVLRFLPTRECLGSGMLCVVLGFGGRLIRHSTSSRCFVDSVPSPWRYWVIVYHELIDDMASASCPGHDLWTLDRTAVDRSGHSQGLPKIPGSTFPVLLVPYVSQSEPPDGQSSVGHLSRILPSQFLGHVVVRIPSYQCRLARIFIP